MKISVLSIFPETFNSFISTPVVKRSIEKKELEFQTVDIKKYASGSFRKIDDSPYGGKPGTLIRVDTLNKALKSVKSKDSYVVMLSPKGKVFNQKKAREFSKINDLILVCGHYEGIDARFEEYVDELISIGDYILTGGEIASMVICDSIIRLLKGSLRETSTLEESFENHLLEYPQYTHPFEYDGKKVPSILLSGNKKEIDNFQNLQSVIDTIKYRPDLFNSSNFKSVQVGYSKLQNYKINDISLKINCTKAEYDVLKALDSKLKVQKALFYQEKGGFLVLSIPKGKMLCDKSIIDNTNRVYKSAIASLRTLWEVDISSLNLDYRLEKLLQRARFNVENNLVRINKAQLGILGFDSYNSLFNYLYENRPKEKLVFSHGLLCLPNIIVSCKGIECFLNLENSGISDLYRDLDTIVESLKEYLGSAFDETLFFSMLDIPIDKEKLRYYHILNKLL